MLILPAVDPAGGDFSADQWRASRLAPMRSGELLALLYFTNCLGAAIGVLVSGFFLIGQVGLPEPCLPQAC